MSHAHKGRRRDRSACILDRVTSGLERRRFKPTVVKPTDESFEETLKRIDPLWDWLFESRSGQLEADGEGYYDRSGLMLEVE